MRTPAFGIKALHRASLRLVRTAAAVALLGTIAAGEVQAAELKNVLNGRRGFVIEGTEPNKEVGISVANAGDINGDGLDDILIGEEDGSAPPFGVRPGRCYVVFGKSETSRVSLDDIRSGIGGFVINATELNDDFGTVIAGAGDINADGLDDLLVAAPMANPLGRFGAGTVYVVFGKADTAPVLDSDLAAGIGGYAIHGAEEGDRCGMSVAGAGDVNGDGLRDIVLAAQNGPDFTPRARAGYVLFGKADTAPQDLADTVTESLGFIFRGNTGFVAGVGDMNDDGLDDVAAGEGLDDRVAVVFGRTNSGDFTTQNLFGEGNGFVIAINSDTGLVPSAAGDVNNDGRDDILVGNPVARLQGGMVGSAYVIFGRTNPSDVLLSANAIGGAQGFIIKGVDDRGFFGISLSAAGDQNGDGFDDVLIGAPQVTFAFLQEDWDYAEGATYLVFGKSTTATITVDDLVAGNGGFEVAGAAVKEFSGRSVAGGGDINGDGRPDLIIGAPGATPHGWRAAGAVYVFFGGFPAYPDADGDTLSNVEETGTGLFASPWDIGSKPGVSDSDNDRFADGVEVAAGSDPNNSLSVPVQGKPPHVVKLTDVAQNRGGFAVHGGGNDKAGTVSGAGDVNGDGIPDMIVGALDARAHSASSAGTAYVVFGKVGGNPMTLSTIAQGNKGFAITGTNSLDRLGSWVSGAGDVNGDGLDDVVVTAHGRANGIGEVFVVFGKTSSSPLSATQLSNGHGGFVIRCSDQWGLYRECSGAGDVNGDGLDDIIVGTPDGQGGSATVIFGRTQTTPVLLDDVISGNGGFHISGRNEYDYGFGSSVSGAGDVNGDGLDDLIVGSPLSPGVYETSGAAFVVFGKTATTPVHVNDLRNGIGGIFIEGGPDTGIPTYTGVSVSGAGDVNGDGLDDVIVGAPFANQDHAIEAAESWVIFGKQDTAKVSLPEVEQGTGGFVIRGIGPYNSAGSRVSDAGDVNRDGLDDVIVGAEGFQMGGKAYVVFGKPDTTPVHLMAVQAGTGGLAIEHQIPSGCAGMVSGVNDMNGDGYDDVIVGSPCGAGHAYIVYGFAPAIPDADQDLIPDYAETGTGTYIDGENTGTNPNNSDSDGDGILDGIETGLGTDPNDPLDFPDGLPLEGAHLAFVALIVSALLTFLGVSQSRRNGP